MRSCFWSFVWITVLFSFGKSLPWINPSGLLDEDNDFGIYNAVVQSMNQWQLEQDRKKSINRTKREEPTVCYEDLGCFDASGEFGYLDMLPSKPEEINTKFLLYPARNRHRRSGSVPIEVSFEKLNEAFEWAKDGFNKSLPTKVLIHGFGSDCGYIWAYEIRSALMAIEEVNTICVDWSNGASLPNYVKASANTRLVGKQLSLLLRGLVEKNGLSLEDTHLIGFSLGAHIAGFTGADLGNLSRITGLDPAGPLFESQDTRARLDETDAAFVDVIHSNGENLILGGLGSSQPMGHVDFYPNGGRMQKGCSHLFVGAVSDIIWSSAVEGRSLCNHRRAYKFFIDSVSPRCHFPAFPCDSYDNFISGKCFPCTDQRKCGNMGYYADRSKGRGQLYLVTREEEPFCAHQYLVRIETTPTDVPMRSYGKMQITFIGDAFLNETFLLTRKEDEEMKLGESISKIIVLHPILSQPRKIEILYTAYSGWLSSGLTQWKIDKVLLMDSFGKISSICKRAQVLDSGVPVILPLYPRDCNTIQTNSGFNEDNIMEQTETGILQYTEKDNHQNLPDTEAESSRAFNSDVINAEKSNEVNFDAQGSNKEVVEPILKMHSTKTGRARVTENAKSEITEPILSPTVSRSSNNVETAEDLDNNKTFHQETASIGSTLPKIENISDDSWKKHVAAKKTKDYDSTRSQSPVRSSPLDAIVTNVQFLPRRLAKIFEQAEKYAKETILPLVSTYTPRFISDFIAPREQTKYLPLRHEKYEVQQLLPQNIEKSSIPQGKSTKHALVSLTELSEFEDTVTPSSNIQKIAVAPIESSFKAISNESGDLANTSTFGDTKITNSESINPYSNNGRIYQIAKSSDLTGRKRQYEDYGGVSSLNYPNHHDIGIVNNSPKLIENLENSNKKLPLNIAKVLNKFPNYTKNNVLEFIQTYFPQRLSDLIRTSTLNTERSNMNNSSVQESKNNMTWSTPGDFEEMENYFSKHIRFPGNKTANILHENVETGAGLNYIENNNWTSIGNTVNSSTNSNNIVSGEEPVASKQKYNFIIFHNSSCNIYGSRNQLQTRKQMMQSSSEKPTLAMSEFSKTNKNILFNILLNQILLNISTENSRNYVNKDHTDALLKIPSNIQKIPKRNEVIEYKFPQVITLDITAYDEITYPPSTSVKPRFFKRTERLSYIQKIPRRKSSYKTPLYQITINTPWNKDFSIGDRTMIARNQNGADTLYRITSDGRFKA